MRLTFRFHLIQSPALRTNKSLQPIIQADNNTPPHSADHRYEKLLSGMTGSESQEQDDRRKARHGARRCRCFRKIATGDRKKSRPSDDVTSLSKQTSCRGHCCRAGAKSIHSSFVVRCPPTDERPRRFRRIRLILFAVVVCPAALLDAPRARRHAHHAPDSARFARLGRALCVVLLWRWLCAHSRPRSRSAAARGLPLP